MASGTINASGSADVTLAAYERLRIYDAGGLVGTLSLRNTGGTYDVIAGLDQWTTGETRAVAGPGTFRISVTAGAARYISDGTPSASGAFDGLARDVAATAAGRLDKGLSSLFYNFKPSNVYKLRAAMQRRDRNCLIAIAGPSTTAGQSTGGGAGQAVNSWPMQMARMLQAEGIPAGAGNFFADHSCWGAAQTVANYVAGDSRIVATGAAALDGRKGPGGNIWSLTAAGDLTFTPQVACTKADIYWRDNTTGHTFSWAVDGGAATNISSTGVAQIAKTTISLGALGTHAIKLAWVAGTVYILGVHAYDDTAGRKEISVLNWGISGANSTQLINDTDTTVGRLKSIGAFAPDAVVIDDWPINDARQSILATTTRANIKTMAQRVLAAGGVPILTTQLPDGSTSGLTALQADYAAMLFGLADELDIPLMDFRGSIVSYELGNAAGLYSDNIHPTALGNAVKAAAGVEMIRAIRRL